MSDIQYQDDDFVYVDPERKLVVGLVEWEKEGVAKKKLQEPKEEREKNDENTKDVKGAKDNKEIKNKRRDRPRRERYCVWGKYGTLKRVYKLERREEEGPTISFDEAVEKLTGESGL